MLRSLLLLVAGLSMFCLSAQEVDLKSIKPDSNTYENVYVMKMDEDSMHSSYIIWVKNGVGKHYHGYHTELIYVISGKGVMVLNEDEFRIRKGDYILIPAGYVHSVETTSRKPLKVFSVQTPKFDGDRVWIEKL